MNEATVEQVLHQVPAFLKKIHGWVHDGGSSHGDAGERARLRRARHGPEAYAFEATAHLFPAGRDDGIDEDGQRLIGCLAILLAQVRGEVGEKVFDETYDARESRVVNGAQAARKLGEMAGQDKETGSSPRLARLRFGRMMRAFDADDRLRAFRDLLALLGIERQSDFDRWRLAEIFLRWHQPRIQFAFARGYFASLNREQSTPDADEMQPNPATTV